jgi:hypothetical protein
MEEEDGSIAKAEDEVNVFLARYPQDPRAAAVERYKERIELDKLERSLNRKHRGSALADPTLLPAEQLYLRAVGLAESSPDKALSMLESLVNLYGADADVSANTERNNRDESVTTSDIVQLARRRIGTLKVDLARQHERQLAALNERLDAAEKLSRENSEAASAMYQAMIDLHQNDSWAAAIVAKARRRLDELKR